MKEIEKTNIEEIVNIIGNAELSNKCHKECFINTDFDNECTLCRQATTLDKAGYRKQSDTVKEFAEKLKKAMAQFNYYYSGSSGIAYYGIIGANDFSKMLNELVEQYGKEEK